MRRHRWMICGCVLLSACAPAVERFNPQALPAPGDFGPKPAQLEWWYASGYFPESEVAFHWAQFKVIYKGIPFYTSHLAVTDLRNDKLVFQQQNTGEHAFQFPPLLIRQGEWKLEERAGKYALTAGPLNLNLTPVKPPVLHPPGYSGTPEVGQMYYQSVTRLDASGTVNGREVKGQAWFDHQWGDQLPARSALWDWFGLHLSNNVDVMVYRVKNVGGKVVQLAGSWVDKDGAAHALTGLQAVPGQTWQSPTGRTYTLGWELQSDQFNMRLNPVREAQELLSGTTFVAYWEGPLRGEGDWQGEKVQVQGMGEFVGGGLLK